jgi:branched-chain amino acid transport system permease protein
VTTFVVVVVSSLGLAGLYFLFSAGLSLIFGLMGVLNMAHGAFFSIGGYVAWIATENIGGSLLVRFLIALVAAAVVALVSGALVEKLLIARNYGEDLSQLLITLGLGFAIQGLLGGVFTYEPKFFDQPEWFSAVTRVGDVRIPNDRLLIAGVAILVWGVLSWFLAATRHGLIIRAGVENRRMVEALGIDVGRSFTLVFAIGGLLAGLAGVLGTVYFNGVTPTLGPGLLIFSFIVVIIGGLGSVTGTAIAALAVAFCQQLVNLYVASGLGDIAVVALLVVILLTRPQGLLGRVA